MPFFSNYYVSFGLWFHTLFTVLPFFSLSFYDFIWYNNMAYFSRFYQALPKDLYGIGGELFESKRDLPGDDYPRRRQNGVCLSGVAGDLLQLGL